MKKYSRKLAALAAAASLALTGTLAGCSSSGNDHKIRIGIKFDQPGLGYQDGSQWTSLAPTTPPRRICSCAPITPISRARTTSTAKTSAP